ncbi:MAG: hypothetical protein MK008_07740 [Bdellovibrionales bacterium]|nr:hypothetical protein [Bdellovibrionales bacterium]
MDTFDDFEIKPITKGLGFHQKQEDLKSATKQSRLAEDHLPKKVPQRPSASESKNNYEQTTYEDLLASIAQPKAVAPKEKPKSSMGLGAELDKQLEITSTFPRKDEKQQASPEVEIPQTPEFPNPFSTPSMPDFKDEPKLNKNKIAEPNLAESSVKRGAHDSKQGRLKPAAFSLSSVILDTLVVVAIALAFLISLLWVTQVDLIGVMTTAQSDIATQLSLAVLYVAVYQMYVIVSRSFFGRTLGEWTFDHQLGDEKQQKSGMYPLQVVWRSLLITATGIIVLPLLSMIFRKDLASYFTGLQLYKERR